MADPPLAVRACVFDAYGTLFDVASTVAACADALGDRTTAFATLWRDRQLQYSWLRGLQGRHADFWQVTGEALDFSLDAFGLADPQLRERLMDGYRRLTCFPDAPDALKRLKAAGLLTAILSNGSPRMLAEAVSASGLAPLVDHVLSVEAVGVFKPHPSVYQLAVDRLALPADRIAFISSNGWDAYAAAAFGLRAIWCNRTAQPPERLPGAPEHVIVTLADLAALLTAGRTA